MNQIRLLAPPMLMVAIGGSIALGGKPGRTAQAAGGMVAAAHPDAVSAGLEMLRQGGNAVDAAVAAAFALTVVEPHASSIAGDGAALVYSAADGRSTAYGYRCEAPAAATPEVYPNDQDDIWNTTVLGPAVPGMLKGTLAMHEDHGLLTRQQVLAPAIRYAREGFEAGPTLVGLITDFYDPLLQSETGAALFLPDGFPPDVGTTLTNPDLAESLELIAEQGESAFYNGPLTEKFAAFFAENGGTLTAEDFANYELSDEGPIAIDYEGYTVVSTPPPFGGIAVLQALQLYERVDTSAFPGPHSAENIHVMGEVMKLMAADRYSVSGDPNFVEVPTAWIISEEYADLRIKDLSTGRATVRYEVKPSDALEAQRASGSTTHLTVVDAQGNAVTLTQTLGSFFGSLQYVPETGIVFNDQMKNFSGGTTSPNRLLPGKKMNSTQSPTIVTRDGELVLALGSPGAYRIVTTLFQVLAFHLHWGMDLQEANDAPRITARHSYRDLSMESRITDPEREKLRQMGHELDIKADFDLFFGGVHAIARDPETGMLTGSADRRRSGVAQGLEP